MRDIPPSLQDRPFSLAEGRSHGLSRRKLSGRRFRHLHRDAYVSAALPDSVEMRCDAAARVLPAQAGFCTFTAARLRRLPLPRDTCDLVHASVPPGVTVPKIAGVVGHESQVREMSVLDGRRVTDPEQTFVDLAPHLGLTDLVVLGDALTRYWCSLENLIDYVRRAYRRRGLIRAREAVTLIDPNAGSPMESKARLPLIFAGLPRPECNLDIVDDAGGWLLRPDLALPQFRLGIEYDGRIHREDDRKWRNDRYRRELADDLGWAILQITADDVERRRGAYVARVERRLRQQAVRLGLPAPPVVPYLPNPVVPYPRPRDC